MGLSSELASQFVKVTNDSKSNSSNATLRGIITKYGEDLYVQIDGSNELTPVARTVEVAEGDRVRVEIANHSATVTGNLSDPAIGVMRAGNMESKIEQTAEQIRLEVSDLEKELSSSITLTASEIRSELTDGLNGLDSKITQTASEIRSELSNEVEGLESKITQNADSISTLVKNDEEFSEFKQTVEGFSFMGTGGTVKISGGDINLTGSITFSDFNSEVTDEMDATAETANSALSLAGTANSTANSALSDAADANNTAIQALNEANDAKSIAESIAIPDYIKSTYIDSTTIKSPTIEGNQVKVYGTFQTIGVDGGDLAVTGYMGAASGMDAQGNRTVGVALSNAWDYTTYEVSGSYVIVTNAGVRLQHGDTNLVVSEGGIYLNASGTYVDDNGNTGTRRAYYNGVEIGSGTSATVTAVWG